MSPSALPKAPILRAGWVSSKASNRVSWSTPMRSMMNCVRSPQAPSATVSYRSSITASASITPKAYLLGPETGQVGIDAGRTSDRVVGIDGLHHLGGYLVEVPADGFRQETRHLRVCVRIL